jgi:F-type H+-transporting ATPase subunit b
LPQLDISTWPSQLFWLVVLFTTGYIIMAKFVTPRIGTVLEERRAKLDNDIGKARVASEDAARIRAEYEADLDAARSAATEIAKQATAEAGKKAEVGDSKIAKKLAEKVAKAEVKLATARNDALVNLNNVAAEAALSAVAKLADIKITAAQASKTADKLAASLDNQEAN